jgi:hypothetical protein
VSSFKELKVNLLSTKNNFLWDTLRLWRKLKSQSLGRLIHVSVDWIRSSGIAQFTLSTGLDVERVREEIDRLSLSGEVTVKETGEKRHEMVQ